MENVKTKKKHPSLPSNYVSIADLKQRWLKQKEQEKEEAEQKERERDREIEEAEQKERQRQREKEEAEERERHRFHYLQKQQQPREPVVVVRTRSSPGIRNIKKVQHWSEIRTDSGTNSFESKKMKKKRNYKVVEKGKEISEESEFSEANKCTIESGLKEVEKNVKQNPNVEEGEKKENEAMAESESSEAKKSTAETELNEEKKKDSIVDEVEERFGGLSVNYGNGKQGEKINRVNKGFGHSQSVRTNEYYFGGSRHGFSHGYGGFGRHNDKRNKVVWVKKGGNGNGGGGGEAKA